MRATVSKGESASRHTMLVSSMGMYWLTFWRWICKAKQDGVRSVDSCWYSALRRKLGRSRFCGGGL
ncbi:hypothetical protein D9M71_639700 [compost metagenome]